jgi:hypothetical protein
MVDPVLLVAVKQEVPAVLVEQAAEVHWEAREAPQILVNKIMV